VGGAFYELGPSHEPEGAEKEKGEAAFWAPTMAMIASTTKAIVHTKPFPRAFAFFFISSSTAVPVQNILEHMTSPWLLDR
jgi:hypothetical protein